MNDIDQLEIAGAVLRYVEKLIESPTVPQIPEQFASDPQFIIFHEKILTLRAIAASFATGDLSPQITLRGVLAGSYKALQANLRHMAWKVQQVEKGDYSQRVNFMGDFSLAFNSMVQQLATSIEALKQKEEALTNLAKTLQEEARRRSEAMVRLKKSEAEFKYLADHDPLTGALNRRSFFDLAMSKMERSFSLGKSCCVSLLDVDFFKIFNDTHGHVEGDRALRHVVKKSQENLRQADIMGRYGGEEFIFFFTDGDASQGEIAANRIRQALAATPFELQTGEMVDLRASLGVAVVLPDWGKDQSIRTLLEQAINQADAALYQAKSQGRNRVAVAPIGSGLGEASSQMETTA